MAATASNPQPTSKSAKKKAAKAAERTASPAPSTASGSPDKGDSADGAYESPYIKELQKNIRNINKKITNVSKTDDQLKQHPGKSLDQLVDAKIINADQKAQILKKPALQAQLAQAEEQLTQYQKVHEQYQARSNASKADLDKAVEQAKKDAVAETKEGLQKAMNGNLLVLSQFLRLAAYRREEAQDPEADESQAIEGVLLAIYAGDDSAVNSMLKLVEGSSDQILSVPGEQLQTSYANIKTLAQEYKTPFYAEGAPEATAAAEATTDPTVAHASGTEIAAGDVQQVNGVASEPVTNGISNGKVSDETANHVGETRWDSNNDTSLSQEWVDVKVPRDPTETETGHEATPAAAANKQSWADDTADMTPETAVPASAPTPSGATPADPNDGFHQVQRNNRRNEREGGGGHRGRGRGEYRGRGGHRGDGRGGRGRGNRGSGPASRGGRRPDES